MIAYVPASELPGRTQEALAGNVLTPQQVAEILQLDERTVVYHFQKGRIKAKKIGCRWRCLRSDLDRYLSSE